MNPIYQMVSQQLATKNPMMATMIKNLSSGMTPKQMVMNLMKNNTNPMLSQLVNMANNGNINSIENMARQLFQQNGRSFDNEFNNFKGTITPLLHTAKNP